MIPWVMVLTVYGWFGVAWCLAFALAMGPRMWRDAARRELLWLAVVCIACVPAWPLVLAVGVAMQSERIAERFTRSEDGR